MRNWICVLTLEDLPFILQASSHKTELIVNKFQLWAVINEKEGFISRIWSGQGDAFIQFINTAIVVC